MSIINSKTPIFCNDHIIYKSIVFDAKKYYCLSEQANAIDIYDETFHFLSKIKLEQHCDNMTFNSKRKFFYFHSKYSNLINKIIITDINFKKIKEIRYKINEYQVNSIYYSEIEDRIYLITNNSIIKMNELGSRKRVLSRYQINERNNRVNPHALQEPISSFMAMAIMWDEVYLSYCRGKESYLAKIEKGEIIEERLVDTECYIHNIIKENDILQLFVSQGCNYLYETNLYTTESSKINDCGDKVRENCNDISKNQYNKYYKEDYSNCCSYSKIESVVQEQRRNSQYVIA